MNNFKEQYLQGIIDIKSLDDFVDMWHKNSNGMTLQEFLGLDDIEYTAFAHSENELKRELDKSKKKVASFFKSFS